MKSCVFLLSCALAFTAAKASSKFCDVINGDLPLCTCTDVQLGFTLTCTVDAVIPHVTEKPTNVVATYDFQPCAGPPATMGYSASAKLTPVAIREKTTTYSLAKKTLSAKDPPTYVPIPEMSVSVATEDVGFFLVSTLSGNVAELKVDLSVTLCVGEGTPANCPPSAVTKVIGTKILPQTILSQTLNFDSACKAAGGGGNHTGTGGMSTGDDVGIAVGCIAGLGLVGLGIHQARKKRRENGDYVDMGGSSNDV